VVPLTYPTPRVSFDRAIIAVGSIVPTSRLVDWEIFPDDKLYLTILLSPPADYPFGHHIVTLCTLPLCYFPVLTSLVS